MALILVLTITGCAGPGYYLQAASGHWRLMRARQDIENLLTDPGTDPALARRLETARDIIGFAEKDLGLPAGSSYSQYVATGREAVTWNVVATPEFSLAPKRWCFLVAGCVPYRGFFEVRKARASADRMAARGMDVSVSAVVAYSTLGWFRDPLLDTMLAHSDLRLAATLIHELAHRRLYVKGHAEFSEGYARFVERAGVDAWLAQRGDAPALARWRRLQRATDAFNGLLLRTREQLARLYVSGLPPDRMRAEKRRRFDQLQADYAKLRERQWNGADHFAAWMQAGLNNAHLALVHSYEGAACAFASMFRETGNNFDEFHKLAERRARWKDARLDAWLAQDCSAIASADDL